MKTEQEIREEIARLTSQQEKIAKYSMLEVVLLEKKIETLLWVLSEKQNVETIE